MIKKEFAKNSWIVEGTTRHLIELGLDSADRILFLEHENLLKQYIILFKRYLSRHNETFIDAIKLAKHLFMKRYNLGINKHKVPLK